ncbi:hypothetical protein FACS1894152_6350 [Bacilli bacterium]|nr:hypothetical protein FACS1894152_6350 [Bacilli bacterium]
MLEVKTNEKHNTVGVKVGYLDIDEKRATKRHRTLKTVWKTGTVRQWSNFKISSLNCASESMTFRSALYIHIFTFGESIYFNFITNI